MNIVTFETAEQRSLGLQFMPSIPDDTVFVFPTTRPGALFHSQNVPEPFEIAFMSASGRVLLRRVMTPPNDAVVAPPGTTHTYEARPGVLNEL